MCLEELVKGSNSSLRLTRNGLLVHDDVEMLDAVVSFSNTQEKRLSRASVLEEGLNAFPDLREKETANESQGTELGIWRRIRIKSSNDWKSTIIFSFHNYFQIRTKAAPVL